MKAYFSPGESCRNAIIAEIENAKHELRICVFTISDDQITQAILEAHKRNVSILIITDNDKVLDLGSDVDQLSKSGIPVRIDMSRNHMHHKFMVSDKRSLLTGSYNWTNSAARFNQENIIVSQESEAVKSFLREFDRLWEIMTEY